ncbi:MAG: phosphoribosylformylglycinamidine synthase, partial [Intestinimonas sp.]|uniref:phosphoribosylformylglycinamidine synthase n=1 Tax=Intestinimonas sp. TaxID=1965293 RepID=UPI002A90A971
MVMVFRCFVEKKPGFDGAARALCRELTEQLGVRGLERVRVLNRYDVEGVDAAVYAAARTAVFSEPQVDAIWDETMPPVEGPHALTAVEALPGQYDQRADSAAQCIQLMTGGDRPAVAAAAVYVLLGQVPDADLEKVKKYLINPVESREASLDKPDTLTQIYPVPGDVPVLEGFRARTEEALGEILEQYGLAMDRNDLKFFQDYMRDEEGRDPTVTELRLVDTYWSDHCRHTTFATHLDRVEIEAPAVRAAYERYLAARVEVYGPEKAARRPQTLMDLATIGTKTLKKRGLLPELDESEEINACSIHVPAVVDGQEQDWLLMFKNETHNHPTEIEPFGGAATCIGGCIRDPLSGRVYVHQAMRVTGGGDPRVPMDQTLEGKLPQRKIAQTAAAGYSSYGNQIGLATGHVAEVYHPGYVAKRLECGAVVGAAPADHVVREEPAPGDVVILLGGRTGRDGIGGATGSSKSHDRKSLDTMASEVQKGNAPEERKIQRLFRRGDVTRLIKRCNDFGAGGVSVAIGELAAGLQIDLDKVPKKYAGLDGTEIAISESQERMAVVVDPGDVDKFLAYAGEENLEAVTVAVVTKEPRLVLNWRGKTIVDISRAFLDTNGAHQEADVTLEVPGRENSPLKREEVGDVKRAWTGMLAGLNVCSQKGLVERFDGSIGAGSVFMPYGGKYQLTETQAMVAKLPVLEGSTDTVTMMSYGFDPYLSSWSPYHGAVYAVLTSVAKIVAAGGDYSKIRFTFQEYFRRMNENPKRWSQPFAALLGAYSAQMGFGLPSIGGKDSMSGTFDDEHGEVNVPPTLVSFAVDVNSYKNIITPEFKKPGSKIVVFKAERDGYDLPVYGQVMDGYGKLFEDIKAGRIISAYAVEGHGMAEAVSKMAFGNKLGVKIEHSLDPRDFFAPGYGDIVCEVPDGLVGELSISYTVIGEVTDRAAFEYGSVSISLDEALESWTKTLEDVFPTATGREKRGEEAVLPERLYKTDAIYICDHKIGSPTVFIPVFP